MRAEISAIRDEIARTGAPVSSSFLFFDEKDGSDCISSALCRLWRNPEWFTGKEKGNGQWTGAKCGEDGTWGSQWILFLFHSSMVCFDLISVVEIGLKDWKI